VLLAEARTTIRCVGFPPRLQNAEKHKEKETAQAISFSLVHLRGALTPCLQQRTN
jgi:hypothetical protein